MKFTTVALIGAASATFPANWPKMDLGHAHCEMDVKFMANCDTAYLAISNTLANFESDQTADPGKGTHVKFARKQGDFLWDRRTTFKNGYVDDLIFNIEKFDQETQTCSVTSKSRSQSFSFWDFYVNYCSLRNVIEETGLEFSEPSVHNCRFEPNALKLEQGACRR